jgi:hypothetical protein
MRKYLTFLIIAVLISAACSRSQNSDTIYYVDPGKGDDASSGKSPSKAWRSLNRIGNEAIVAGSTILLNAGVAHHGTLRLGNIEGTAEKPVIISSYGGGRAIIESDDSAGFVAIACSYLKINNIAVSGSGRLKGNRTNGLELINCAFSEIDSVSADGYLYSGIRITGGNDIRITHSKAFDNGFCGINVESGENEYGADGSSYKTMRNLYIGNCIADNNPGCPEIKNNHSGNGILIGGVINGIIEHCEAMNNGWDMPREGNGPVGIWAYMSDSIIIRNCYSHNNKTSPNGKDGGGFDFDGGVRYSVMEYNLSAFNEGAGYGIFQYAGATEWTANIARYNISYNDGSKNGQCGILVWSDPAALPMNSFRAYNNTIINSFAYGINFEPGAYKDFLFENNILNVTVPTDRFIGGTFTLAEFRNNLCIKQPLSYTLRNIFFL